MVHHYHNIPLRGFVVKELLLARLAWTLLPLALTHFLWATQESRMLWIRNDHGKLIPQKMTAQQCQAIANTPLPRSTSRSFDLGLGSGKEDESDDDEDDDDNDDDSLYLAVDAEELTRGRKRLRAGDT